LFEKPHLPLLVVENINLFTDKTIPQEEKQKQISNLFLLHEQKLINVQSGLSTMKQEQLQRIFSI
jgi:hypothetical protein